MPNEKRGDGTVGKALDVLSEVAEIGSPTFADKSSIKGTATGANEL